MDLDKRIENHFLSIGKIQGHDETLSISWPRTMVNNPLFYNGLLYNIRLTINTAAGGALMDKLFQEVY